MTTWVDLVREVADEAGWSGTLTDDDVEWILWERTSFPMGSMAQVRGHVEALFAFALEPEPRVHGGPSCCPMCGRVWWVTPLNDCCLPVCGCWGSDTSAANPDRPCETCGIGHWYRCERRQDT